MQTKPLHKVPTTDPVSGSEFYIAELRNDESGVSLRGRFHIPRYARLDEEQLKFLETFLRCRGMLNGVERELGISYPTVKNRLDQLLTALELQSARETAEAAEAAPKTPAETRADILKQLEDGVIDAKQAREMLGNLR
ncbi:MAG: DUF2089 domain-containing protein [Fimbriimonas sp.]